MICLNCGAETTNPKFCSKTCSAQYNNKRFPRRDRARNSCEKCGAEARSRRRFCDKCNPMNGADWTKRTLSYVRSFLDYNARIRQLARRAYEKSSKPKKCARCGYTKHIEICHIRSIQDFPDDTPISVINSLDNLVALCPNCHWEFDHGLLSSDLL